MLEFWYWQERISFDFRNVIMQFVSAAKLSAAIVLVATTLHPGGGVPVQLTGSRIEIQAVGAEDESDYDVINRRQGPIYYHDCLSFVTTGAVGITRIQFMFALVNGRGEIKWPGLPVDQRYKAAAASSGVRGVCRKYAYGNRQYGLQLVAWSNIVEFADGTSWHAPPADRMKPYILAALRSE